MARRCYDGQGYNGNGCTGGVVAGQRMRLTGTGTAVSNSSFAYDAIGRIVFAGQSTNAVLYSPFLYTYNSDGSVKSTVYPSGRVVSNDYDQAGRVSAASGVLGAVSTGYTGSYVYAAHGGVQRMKLGSALWEETTFNNRLQPLQMRLGTTAGGSERWSLTNNYGSTANNGNVTQQTLQIPGLAAIAQHYRYDELNRLLRAVENPVNAAAPVCPDAGSSWCQEFGYDVFGNRKVAASTNVGVSANPQTVFSRKNRNGDAGWLYDGRGNVTKNPLGDTFGYDAEDRMTSYCPQVAQPCTNGVGGTVYGYDADGRRVAKTVAGATTVFVYDGMGRLGAEYGGTAAGTQFLTQDHLGSTRVTTDGAGAVVSYRDYYPFGEEIGAGGVRSGVAGYLNGGPRQRFTGKERDAETGLDYFGARYMAAVQGRFTSPDAPFADQHSANPQSWNLYSYARNNPLLFVDEFGQKVIQAVLSEAVKKMDNKDRTGGPMTLAMLGIHNSPDSDYANNKTPKSLHRFSGRFGMGTIDETNSLVVPNANGVGEAMLSQFNNDQVDTAEAIVMEAQERGIELNLFTHSNGVNGAASLVGVLPANVNFNATVIVAPNTGLTGQVSAIANRSGTTEIVMSNKDKALRAGRMGVLPIGLGSKRSGFWRRAFRKRQDVHVTETENSGHGAQHYADGLGLPQ